ncbi:MAG TPA: pseudouridine synthase [Chitinispirillaceae bacterium]|nr:pseudouridine synthase [Chitinispirillaceae bacterium]
MSDKVPLNRVLSKLGYASRNQAVEMITSGEISINGDICRDPQRLISMETAKIYHNGTLLKPQKLLVIMLYKPKGVITSRKDEQGRPTVYSLLPPELHKLHCAGRLDWATSGLLLLTNNTVLSSWLTDPHSGVPRIYVVTVRGLVTGQDAEKMLSGITDDFEELKSDAVIIRKSSRRESHLVMTLTEGKNREVRRLCSSTGHEVTKLKRVQYGPLTLGNLAPGEYRELSIEEMTTAFPQIADEIIL